MGEFLPKGSIAGVVSILGFSVDKDDILVGGVPSLLEGDAGPKVWLPYGCWLPAAGCPQL
jgi:hypothetical protein